MSLIKQLQIVEKLSSSTGVLVQGPPGTGKSHTIANLICHLLATGQRVLVTAKAPRALKVLNDQLPEKIRPLCISLLGSGIEEQKSLELSVNSILRNQDKWNQHDASHKVEELHKQLSKLKSDKSEIENRLRTIREADSVEQSLFGGIYQGTTAKISKKIKNEESDFEWIKDKISYDQDLLVPSEEIIRLHKELIHFSPDLDAYLNQFIPDPEVDLPSPDILRELLQKGNKTKKLITDLEALLNSPIEKIVEKAKQEFLQDLIGVISKLIQAVEMSEEISMPWIKRAIHDVFSDNDSPWNDLRRVFSNKLEGLKQRAEAIDTYSIQLPEHIDRIKVLQNAIQLKEHFDKGGKLGWGPVRARVVRENIYIIKDIKVDSNSCKNNELLKILIEYLSVEQAIDYCWNLWQDKVERKSGRTFLQVSELEELQKNLNGVINIKNLRKEACSLIETIEGLHKPKLADKEEIINFFNTCSVANHKIELERIRKEWTENISRINSLVKKSKTHPIVKKALSALRSGNVEEYNNIFIEISHLKKESERAVQARSLLDRLAKFAPILARELSDNPSNIDWPDRLINIEKGWLWKRAKSYLEDYLNKDDIPGLQRRLGQLENDIRECLIELSSTLAWKFCFSRMGEAHRRNLVGWELAIRKLGKGTGKHAPKHRRDAQYHLNQCKDAIPAWIMPLHRVYDSVKAAPSIFDVVIIDEASQCGYEALPLTYLAKKILIVGDDKQISPEAVGIDRAVIFQKINEHLSDFEHKESFDVESSLFDHGRRRFGKSGVVLLEHFRCMPEIIQFSNNHWYHSTLIPLRQYPPNHLDPIALTLVSNGYREGRGVRIVNIPEAEVLVEKVIECCRDKQYANKTMGVIVLQGEAQAFQIEDMLLKQLGANEMENRKLICGNPYSFQGDERDIIFLSMVTAPNERSGTLTRSYDQRRLNVACSRAKDQMWLFHSVKRTDLSKSCLRWKLLEYFEDPKSIILNTLGVDFEKLRALARSSNRQIEKPPKPFDSWFEVDVVIEVASRGYKVIPQYEIAGKRIDFVVEGTDRRVAIECDGDHWHGLEQYEKDTERQRMLERSGWIFHHIREFAFYAFRDKALDELWRFLKQNGIKSTAESDESYDSIIDSKNKEKSEKQQDRSPYKKTDLFGKAEKYAKPKYRISGPLFAKTTKPVNINQALLLKTTVLGEVIIETLKKRPNYSCTKDALPGYVLKYLGIVSRSKPREKFARKVLRTLPKLQEESRVSIYKSKNIRVKLLNP